MAGECWTTYACARQGQLVKRLLKKKILLNVGKIIILNSEGMYIYLYISHK